MSSQYVNYEPKPEKRYAIRKTTIIEDVRNVRFSKTYPFASCRTIKADLSLRIRDDTILRSLFAENSNSKVHQRSHYFVKDTPKTGWSLPKATWTSHFQKVDISFGQMSLSWCLSVEQVQNSMSVDHQTPVPPKTKSQDR